MVCELHKHPSGDSSLACSPETAAEVDKEVLRMVKEAHEKE